MGNSHDEQLPSDLADVSARLRASRPAADGPILDRVMLRAHRARRGQESPLPRGSFMKRKSIAAALATAAMLVGTTAVAAAVPGGFGEGFFGGIDVGALVSFGGGGDTTAQQDVYDGDFLVEIRTPEGTLLGVIECSLLSEDLQCPLVLVSTNPTFVEVGGNRIPISPAP